MKIKSFNYLLTFFLGLMIGFVSLVSFQNYNSYRQQKLRSLVENEIKEVTNLLLDDWNFNSFFKYRKPPQNYSSCQRQ